jgi:predicted Fe-S protein YdhL (DUF1289 family)
MFQPNGFLVSSSKPVFAAPEQFEAVSSPCIGVCTLGPGDICIGCLRTKNEIGNWLNFTALQRNQVISALPQRLESLFAK